MRVGLIVTGGVDRSGRDRVVPVLLSYIERMAARHELHVFVLRYYDEPCTYPLLGATIHDLGRSDRISGVGQLRQIRRLHAAVRAVGPFDLLHAYFGMPDGLVTTQVAARLGVPSIVNFMSGELVSLPDIGYGLQRRWIDRRRVAATALAASRVVVWTQHMARLAAAHDIRADVIPLGIDTRQFQPLTTLAAPPWRLIRIGSLNPVKDYPTLLYAFGGMVARGSDVHLDIVGEDLLDGATQDLCRQLRLDPRVTFHGLLPTGLVAPLLARAHLHVVSSRHEAAGVVALEAASAGVATVGTNVGYIADWAPDRAVAVGVSDPDALAIAIERLLSDPHERSRIAAAARDWTLAHDADWSAQEMDCLYHEVVRRATTSR